MATYPGAILVDLGRILDIFISGLRKISENVLSLVVKVGGGVMYQKYCSKEC